jgi:hypothetical protein
MGTEMTSETLVTFNQLPLLLARQNFINPADLKTSHITLTGQDLHRATVVQGVKKMARFDGI